MVQVESPIIDILDGLTSTDLTIESNILTANTNPDSSDLGTVMP